MARDVSKAVVRKDFLILHVRLCVYVLNLETVPSQKRKKKDEFPFVFLNLFYPSLLQKQKWRIGLVHFPRRLITRRRASSGKTFANLKWERAACSIDYLLTLVLLCAHLGSWFQYARRHACPGLVSTKGKISLPFISFFLAWRKMAIFVEYPNILWKKFLDRISCLVSPNNDISTICCRLVIRSPPTFSTLSLCFFFTSLFPCTRIEWAQPPRDPLLDLNEIRHAVTSKRVVQSMSPTSIECAWRANDEPKNPKRQHLRSAPLGVSKSSLLIVSLFHVVRLS